MQLTGAEKIKDSWQVINGKLERDGSLPLTADWDVGGHKITNLSDPSSASDAATKGYADEMPRNMAQQAIINGNFDVWQRGTSFTNPNGIVYSADRYYSVNGGTYTNPTTVTHSRQSFSPGELPGSYYYYRVTTNGAGSGLGADGHYSIRQGIEYGTRYLAGSGKKITISFWARSSIAGKKLAVNVKQSYGTGGSPSATEELTGNVFSLTSTWTKYSVTIATNTLNGKVFGSNNDDQLILLFWFVWGTDYLSRFNGTASETFVGAGTIDIAQVQLNAGESALPFQPRSFAEELALCQRYYEKSYVYGDSPGTVVNNGAFFGSTYDGTNTGAHKATVPFTTRKRIIPTVSIYGVGGTPSQVYDGNADRSIDSGSVVSFVSEANFRSDYTLSGATTPNRAFHWTADAEL